MTHIRRVFVFLFVVAISTVVEAQSMGGARARQTARFVPSVGAELQKLGVDSMFVVQDEAGAIRLNTAVNGQVRDRITRVIRGSVHEIEVESASGRIRLAWNLDALSLTLTSDGGSFTVFAGIPAEGATAAEFAKYADPIRRAAYALDDAQRQSRTAKPPLQVATNLDECYGDGGYNPPVPENDPFTAPNGSSCSGGLSTGTAYSTAVIAAPGPLGALIYYSMPDYYSPEFSNVAFSSSYTRAELCEAARQQAAQGCMNARCIGCCSYENCNANCIQASYQGVGITGDLFCFKASIAGRSCAG